MKQIVPDQHTGRAIEAKSSVELHNGQAAHDFFIVAKQRLIDVNNWDKIARNLSAKFQLVRLDNANENESPRKGDYFKIDIPGPGSKAGRGYDWVQVEEIVSTEANDSESYGIRVRPAENPETETQEVAHFYSSESTSTFLVKRKENIVTAEIYDRNTKPNDEAHTTVDKIRDLVVGVTGITVLSKIQWQGLVNGLTAN